MQPRVATARVATADITEALRRAGVHGVDDSELARSLYATDASLYRVPPRVVAVPRHRDELGAVLAVCRELGVPLTVRGAGTSIAGNAVGTGVVVDVSGTFTKCWRSTPRQARRWSSRAWCRPVCKLRSPATACASTPTPRPTCARRSAA